MLNINKFCLYNFVQQLENLSTNCFVFLQKILRNVKEEAYFKWMASLLSELP